jgi:outer membrane protein OmpA-like peptidoglycan-associated protein
MFNYILVSLRIFVTSFMLMFFTSAACAMSMDDVEKRIVEAEQLRAAEFSPEHYNDAKEYLAEAKGYIQMDQSEQARKALDKSASELDQAILTVQTISSQFSGLVESRDRMQMTDASYLREDLVSRAEQDFNRVVAYVEGEDMKKAKAQAKVALQTLRSAQVVALRKQFVRPVVLKVAEGRKLKARDYAPKATGVAVSARKEVERLIKESPDEQVKMHAIAQQGEAKAQRAIEVATLGRDIRDNPSMVETLRDAEETRLNALGQYLGVNLSGTHSAEQQAMMLQEAVESMQNSYKKQLQDADKEVASLNAKLGIYEGDLASMNELRRKLQLKRDAEAKIERLTKLFNPDEVEILLTPDADVILRMKRLNFRSGSAVISPNTYAMIDNAVEAVLMFSDRLVRVEGHTDSAGGNEYNQALSERRSEAVKAYLMAKLEVPRSVESVGFGEERPIANNETLQGREKNRRIDIVLLVPQQ